MGTKPMTPRVMVQPRIKFQRIKEVIMRIYLLSVLYFFIFFLTLISPAYAITKAKEKDIQALLKIKGTQSFTQRMADMMVANIIAQEKQRYPNMPKKIEYAISNAVQQVMLEHAPELEKMIVPLYDKHYTHSEIKELIKFFSTPIGKKYSIVAELLMQDMMPIAQKWGEKIAPIMVRRVEQELKRYGYE